ncbi:hypothetical protein BG015_000219 [Linnemannia schmuckeri]|uniref:Zincin n=1 Tax=Linnemannia schmuckeri TaxID=64567 RepID=A0A9P5S4I9_9FUNG|nr:hypothetical protein BG015_000219 [Linnemannia schmuckeri]
MVAPKIQILMAIGVALGVVQAGPISIRGDKPSFDNKATCKSAQCKLTANGIISDMDPSVDPCQDFSKFACGGFFKKNDIPSGRAQIGPFDILNDNNVRILRTIVDPSQGKTPKAPAGDVAAQNNIKKLQSLFSSCMDEKAISKAGRKPLYDEVQKIIKLLPASNSPVDKKTLSKILGQIAQYGFLTPGFLNVKVTVDNNNPEANVLTITEDGLGLASANLYKDEKQVKEYRETIAAMFQTVLGDEDVAKRTKPLTPKDIKKEWSDAAKDAVDFEIQLAAIKTTFKDQLDPKNNRGIRTVDQLNAMTPSIDWSFFLQEAFPPGLKYKGHITIGSVIFHTRLEGLLQVASSKSLQRYFTWVLIRSLSGNLAQPYKQPKVNFDNFTNGIYAAPQNDRWATCLTVTNTNLVHITGHYFVKTVFKDNSRQEALAIVDNIIFSYEKTFPTLSWLDEKTRDGAIKKLQGIVKAIGYSTENPDDVSAKSLDDFYKGYIVADKDYFGNQVRYMRWMTAKAFAALPLPVDRDAMEMSLTTVNGFYNPSFNSIYIPAGILQSPVFHTENPEYVNYGGMGTVGGHEIGHAFDNNGRYYDAIGRVTNWWTDVTLKAFEEKTKCFIDQYSKFTVKGPKGENVNLNGEMTLPENLADNAGVKMAFRIWQSRFQSDPKGNKIQNFKLPGLDKYTPEQLFFISYARLWCTKMTPEALVDLVNHNSHSPTQWRINGAAQNSPDFAKAFKCKAGAPMNPTKKCEVW